MAGFYIYETKPLTIKLLQDNLPVVLEDYREIIVTIKQLMSGAVIEKTSKDLDVTPEEGKIVLELSQEDTASFGVGEALIQVNVLYEDSERDVSTQGKLKIKDNLHKEFM